MKKFGLLISFILLTTQLAWGQTLLFNENFSYTVGTDLTANGWNITGTTALPTVAVSAASITYAGYLSSGIGEEVTLATSGQDVNHTFTSQTSGTIYASCLINVTSATTTGDYFFHLGASTIGTTYHGRVYIKRDASNNLAFGISRAGAVATAIFTPYDYALNTSYLLVLKYSIVEGTTNDIAAIYINPTLNGVEPVSGWTISTDTPTDLASIGTVALRQGSSSAAAALKLDGIRVGTTWASIIPAAGTPTITVNPASLSGFSYVVGASASTSQSYDLSGSDLTGYPGNITVTGSTNYEVSDDDITFSGSVTVPYTSATLTSTPIYVRLKSDLSVETYNSETISNAGGGATTQNVTCSGEVYNIEPTNHATGFTAALGTPAHSAIDVTWTDATGTTVPDGYLIKGSDVGYGSITVPADGTPEVNSTLVRNVVQGTETYTFTGLNASTTYYFKIYPYTNSGTGIDYKIDGTVPQDDITTDTAPLLPDVVITEVNDHPTFNYEYVELYNNSSTSVDLTGWKLLQLNSTQTTTLIDNSTNVLDGSLTLNAGDYAIIFRGTTDDYSAFKSAYGITGTINAYTNNKTSTSSGSPQINGAETYKLEDAVSDLIDYFGDFVGGAAPVFSVTVGGLYERKDYPNDGTLSTHWYSLSSTSLGGTPGEANENELPVELSSFSATTIGSTIKLSWQTATEINNFGFDVERKSNVKGQTSNEWIKLGFVNGNGNSNSPKNYSFVDDNVTAGTYSYRLKQIDNDGQFEYSKAIEIGSAAPDKFELSQNYPNPFNPATTINYNLPEAANIKLIIYNILGQEVKTLVNGFKEAGVHTINFNASELNSGLYIYKIEAGSFTQTRKMTLIK